MKLLLTSFSLLLALCFTSCRPKKEKKPNNTNQEDTATLEVLLLGTFHFRNFNPENNGDLVESQIPDVLTDENQIELEKIAKRIVAFKPDKIFVEYPFSKQSKLDSIYSAFPKNADFKAQKRTETNQIGFRVAKLLGHKRVYAMDVRTTFPYDSLIKSMEAANQLELIRKDEVELAELEKAGNDLFNSGKPLSEIIMYYNSEDYRKSDINWYVNLANQAGDMENFVGVHLASEWYKRNLHMYSIIQKTVQNKDEKVMILTGNSHAGMFNEFISYSPDWKSVEFKEIMK